MIILLILIIFVKQNEVFHQQVINNVDVLRMTKCYIDAFYQKQKNPGDDFTVTIDNILIPHLAFAYNIDNCLNQNNIETIKSLFVESSITSWRDETKQILAVDYENNVKKYIDGGESYKNIQHKFNTWRRRFSPMSLSLNSAYLKCAQVILEKFIRQYAGKKVKGKENLFANLNGILNRLKIEIHTNISIAKYSFLNNKNIFDFNSFEQKYNYLIANLESITISNKLIKNFTRYIEMTQFPNVKRIIWVIRHGERLDNDKELKEYVRNTSDQLYYLNDRTFTFDNSPLNENGINRAKELQNIFANIDIQHIFASPYERTIETAHYLLGNSQKNNKNNYLKIKYEPGFLENMLEGGDRELGYENCRELKKYYKRLDCKYKPIMDKNELTNEYKEIESKKSDIGSINRLEYVLNLLLEENENNKCLENKFYNNQLIQLINEGKYKNEWIQPGEEQAENIVIVTHGMTIAAIQNLVGGKFTYAPQTSITKIVQLYDNEVVESSHGSSQGNDNLKNLRLVFQGATYPLISDLDENEIKGYFKY